MLSSIAVGMVCYKCNMRPFIPLHILHNQHEHVCYYSCVAFCKSFFAKANEVRDSLSNDSPISSVSALIVLDIIISVALFDCPMLCKEKSDTVGYKQMGILGQARPSAQSASRGFERREEMFPW